MRSARIALLAILLSGCGDVSIKPEARPLIMKENAARLFGLDGTDTASGGGPDRD